MAALESRVPTDAELCPLGQVWPVQCSVMPFRAGDQRDQHSPAGRWTGAGSRREQRPRGESELPASLQYNRTSAAGQLDKG